VTEFDPEKFEEKYVHYFEELETAYSNAYQALHGRYDSTVLKAVDRQVLSESEPMYEGDGEFRVELPENPRDRVSESVAASEQFDEVLDAMTDGIERELREVFEFDDA
jgi:hypothetical protein